MPRLADIYPNSAHVRDFSLERSREGLAKLNANMQAINVCVCLALGSGTSTDPETFTLRTLESLDHGAVRGLMAAVALAASWLPAR